MDFKIAEITGKYADLLRETSNILKEINEKTGLELDIASLENIQLDTEHVLNIVFVGQYSAGKSTIIKMLTGNEDIEIGVAITTQKYTPYIWNGIEIIDTPGIQTGLREDHDKITEEAIKKADLIVFVITSEMFNNTLINYFRKLAYDMNKADQMLLVVNKMDRGGEKSVIYKDIKEMIEQPYGNYKIKRVDDFSPCFINAEAYLEAREETEEDIKEELYQDSKYEDLIEVLNKFVELKGLLGKIRTPIQQIEDMLNELDDNFYNDNKDEELNKLKSRLNELRRIRKDNIRSLEDIFSNSAQEIISIGGTLASGIDEDTKQEDFENNQRQAEQDLAEIEKERQRMIEDEFEELKENIENFNYANVKVTAQLDRKEITSSSTLKSVKMGVEMAKGGSDTILRTIGKQIYKNKIFFKQSSINKFVAANSAKFSAGIGIVLSLLDKYQEDKKQDEIGKIRRDIYNSFNNMAKELRKRGQEEIIKPISDELDKQIKDIKTEISKNENLSSEYKQAQDNIDKLKDRWKKLSNSLVDL